MRILSRLIFSVLLLFVFSIGYSQELPGFLRYFHHPWVDSTLYQMSLDEKIGQLFIAQVYSNKELPDNAPIYDEIEKHHIGGIIFMQGSSLSQLVITNKLQERSKIPLLVTMDAEWGPGFRLDDAPKYPVQMALGAIQQDSLIYRMGHEIGTQLKRLGVHVNYAPVADVNSNPNNPVINYRSFGEDPLKVAHKTWLYASGMQDAGVLAVAKHFPGHGDTQLDSHLAMPVVKHDSTRLDIIELHPFRYLIEKGIGGIMTAHLHVEAYDPGKGIPASLSVNAIQHKLIGDLAFKGLVITDAMNMSGVSKQFSDGEATVKALLAGNDMLETVPNLPKRIEAIKQALNDGLLSEDDIEWKCRKILATKKWLQLDEYAPAPSAKLKAELNTPVFELTKRLLHEQSLTLLKNETQLMPLQKLDTLKIAVLSIGTGKETYFQKMAAKYTDADFFYLKKEASRADIEKLSGELNGYNLVICGVHDMNLGVSSRYGMTPVANNLLDKIAHKQQIVVLFGNPYALNYLTNAEKAAGLLVTYQENRITQELAAQAIFGGVDVNGKLPVSVNSQFRVNDGLDLKKNGRFKYSVPEEVGMSSLFLEQKIDSIANLGIKQKAFPGCQVLVAKDGKIVFHKCYGNFTYNEQIPITEEAIYDWASLTKITGPLPALIKLHSEEKLFLDLPLSTYWTDFINSNKNKITVREVLAHQAGLRSWIPYYKKAMESNGQLNANIFKDKPTAEFNLRVSSHLYMDPHYIDQIFSEIRNSELLPGKKYIYSDLAFFLFPRIIENLSQIPYDDYIKSNIYAPIGANTVTYNAYNHFPMDRIVPTEQDDFFRKELLRGFVHDEGASMMGGVSGHAGLFGSAIDLAKIMQMYLQFGRYGGEQILDSASVREFTRIQYPQNENRRGLGFDKPYIDNFKKKLKEAYPAVDASPQSFGHSGFTGTFTWADPKNNLLFVFCSNRVNPTRNNSKVYDLNIRPAMHQAIYDSLKVGNL
jgi:beta-glucosidase-like glycosyl hydrolase/CubicO group peptidase (beta-lactamase class C family)